MAHGANSLVARRRVEFFPGMQIRARGSRRINHLPVIQPLLFERAVLNREDVNLAFPHFGRGPLLPLRADRVIDRVSVPLAVGFEDVEVVFAVTEFHAREWGAILAANDLQLSILILWFITGKELIVLGEIADHVLRRIDAKHLRHARLRPVAINAAMTAAAGIRSRIRWQIFSLYDRLFLHWLVRIFW